MSIQTDPDAKGFNNTPATEPGVFTKIKTRLENLREQKTYKLADASEVPYAVYRMIQEGFEYLGHEKWREMQQKGNSQTLIWVRYDSQRHEAGQETRERHCWYLRRQQDGAPNEIWVVGLFTDPVCVGHSLSANALKRMARGRGLSDLGLRLYLENVRLPAAPEPEPAQAMTQ